MSIVKHIKGLVDSNPDYVGDWFSKIYKDYDGTPLYETQEFNNSDTRLSTLKCGNKTVAIVVETLTDLNYQEFIFCKI